MTGARAVIKGIEEEGVETVFGIIGGAIMPIYDELGKSEQIRHVTATHEQGAAHAADAYARVKGEPGVVFATSGPGASNLMTG
ncbi:MAG: thiamine pyrophosphate-binding protein, partial [Candidatus Bipolaricaulota bacterium]